MSPQLDAAAVGRRMSVGVRRNDRYVKNEMRYVNGHDTKYVDERKDDNTPPRHSFKPHPDILLAPYPNFSCVQISLFSCIYIIPERFTDTTSAQPLNLFLQQLQNHQPNTFVIYPQVLAYPSMPTKRRHIQSQTTDPDCALYRIVLCILYVPNTHSYIMKRTACA